MPQELEMVLRVLLASVLGGLIGYQRERADKPAGMRTIMLIAIGASTFTVASIYAFGEATSRVAAGVVTGIGFLGAGSIIRRGEGIVEGLTTAATIWAVAAIGLAAGSGLYLLATAATIIILGTLYLNKVVK